MMNSYKQLSGKNKLMILSLILVALATYQFSIKKTIKLKVENDQIKAVIDKGRQSAIEIKKIGTELSTSMGVLDGEHLSSPNQRRAHFLDLASQNRVTVLSFPNSSRIEKAGKTIELTTIECRGSFKDLVRWISSVEKEQQISFVKSLEVERIEKERNTAPYLLLKAYFQVILK